MRLNIYSQELLTDPRGGEPLTGSSQYHNVTEIVQQKSNTGVVYSAVRLLLHSSERLHHPPHDDDRSALTFWLPKSAERRERLARVFEDMAAKVRMATPETGLD